MRLRARSMIVLAVAVLLLVAAAAPALAIKSVAAGKSVAVGKSVAAGKSGMAGKSSVGHLYLYTKTPTPPGTPWTIVPGPWGKMTYKISPTMTLPQFVFNGHGLTAGRGYTLLNYTGYANVQSVLGTGVADADGNAHIKGNHMTPLVSETPSDTVTPGAKIWLVDNSLLSSAGTFIGWDTSMILFEGAGIPLP